MSLQMVIPANNFYRCWCILVTILFVVPKIEVAAHRRNAAPSDSILDIINTHEVERMIAARRLNATRAERMDQRYLAENDLDEELDKSLVYETPESVIDIEKQKPRDNNRIGVDILIRHYNESSPLQLHEFINELAAYNGHKLLKSSKNALFVTKKEYLKKDWCKTEPLVQRVKEDGCISKTIINRFCYGQCNSFYIPKNPRRRRMKPPLAPEDEREDVDQNGAAFKSCAFCKPKKFTWITVTLRCPTLVPPYRKKRVQKIKQCKCTAADVN